MSLAHYWPISHFACLFSNSIVNAIGFIFAIHSWGELFRTEISYFPRSDDEVCCLGCSMCSSVKSTKHLMARHPSNFEVEPDSSGVFVPYPTRTLGHSFLLTPKFCLSACPYFWTIQALHPFRCRDSTRWVIGRRNMM